MILCVTQTPALKSGMLDSESSDISKERNDKDSSLQITLHEIKKKSNIKKP